MIDQVTSFTSSNGRSIRFKDYEDQYLNYVGIQSTNLDPFVSISGHLFHVQSTSRRGIHR
jgi:hypothetical protein